MAFVDEVMIRARSGSGGNGVVRWLRTKATARGGPSGGDGGKGGDILMEGVHDFAALAHYRYEKEFNAQSGEAGQGELRHGANGASVTLKVPIGTLVRIISSGKTFEIMREGEPVTIFKGGNGGKGNARFKGATNQNPFQQTNGYPGEGGDIELTLKLIADAGLVGLPNAGKSSLLNALTRAKSKVGAYAFTTLEPSLGEFYGRVIADIPGLIEGASSGRGLGVKFLKHIERTGILIHLVSVEQEDTFLAYEKVRKELDAFGNGLTGKREMLVLSKADLVSPEEREAKVARLKKAVGKQVFPISVDDPESLKVFADALAKELHTERGN